ncbi:MAG: hypothetical protein N4A35_04315 [Flavobacteriales bacterium]|jgi:hypothetical protein|nr:hypothetical protein [Flavobacteriales bacterium]
MRYLIGVLVFVGLFDQSKVINIGWEDLVVTDIIEEYDDEYKGIIESPVYTNKQLSYHGKTVKIKGVLFCLRESYFVANENVFNYKPIIDQVIEIKNFKKKIDTCLLNEHVIVTGVFFINNKDIIYDIPYNMKEVEVKKIAR